MYWLLAVPAGAVALYGCGKVSGNEARPASPASLRGREGRSLGGRKGIRGNRLDQVVASLVVAREAGAGRAGEEDRSRRRVADLGNPGGLNLKGRSLVAVVGGRVEGATKPSELRVEPCELSYKAIGGLKGVKCSDNMLYRVNPVFGVVEPGKSSRIDILRQNGGAKIDKIVLVTTKAEDGETPSREVFNQGRSTEMMVLPLLVQE
ncbi:MSP domain protein [Ostertagia ostertagi]